MDRRRWVSQRLDRFFLLLVVVGGMMEKWIERGELYGSSLSFALLVFSS